MQILTLVESFTEKGMCDYIHVQSRLKPLFTALDGCVPKLDLPCLNFNSQLMECSESWLLKQSAKAKAVL